MGAERIFDELAVEQTYLNSGEILGYAKRPVMLNDTADVYGLYVTGSSMDPVYPDGTFVVAQKNKPLSVGDDVILFIRPRDDSDDGERADQVVIKRLVRRTAQFYELRQFYPEMNFRVLAKDVLRVDGVLTLREMLT